MSTRTGLDCFAPEICSLICEDPIFKRRDLNSICFISRPFRREAQRVLSFRFPYLRGAGPIRAWCLSLKRRPHLALGVQDLILVMPRQTAFHADDIARLVQALKRCINLKELAMLSQCRGRGLQDPSTSVYMLDDHMFKLTKFVNNYFIQGAMLEQFLKSQKTLETLQLHSDGVYHLCSLSLPYVKTLACPAQIFNGGRYMRFPLVERLQLDFEDSQLEVARERAVLSSILYGRKKLKSLTILLKRNLHGKQQSHFLDFMDFVAEGVPHIKHLQIHQFLPTHESHSSLSFNSHFPSIKTLVLRPPPRLPINTGDDPNLCAYVKLRTADGRRKAAEKMMKILQTLTRLVFVDHEYDYEFRRDLKSGIITGEELITLDEQEWALVT
ncbi:hypothetical protein BYT27DRAFT_7153851 [Phlegmacium glaucopus]|nr:hypothetical protein BYT27DRAFT_7153851 [Phlegmacium glaucopus]